MADLPSWRRHTHRLTDKAQIYHGQIDDFAPSDDTSYSTSPGVDDSKLPPRPRRSLASFASYLGSHHRTIHPSSRPDWPSIDWSNLNSLNDKDSVYKPDTELMCTTITQQVLANPSADLPAQYNAFLLHLIEAYHQSKADVQGLQMKLVEETKCKQTTVDGYHGAISSWPLEKVHMLQSPDNADLDNLHSTGPGNEVTAARLPMHNSTVKTPTSSFEHENSGQKQKQADKTRTSVHHQSLSSARRYCGPSAATTGFESSRDSWPPSPAHHGMELICCGASSADIEREWHSVSISASDTCLSFEDDFASRLAGWLALRLKCQPGDIISELSELLRSTQNELQRGLTPSTIGTLRPNMPIASGKVLSFDKTQVLPDRSNRLIGTNGSLSFQSTRTLGHHRGFSFLPGDDSANPTSCNAFGSQDMDSELNFIHPMALQDTKQSEHGGSGKSTTDELSGGMASDSRLQQQLIKSIVPSTAGSDSSRNPERDGSEKSARTTTIITNSSRSSSLSYRGSLINMFGANSLQEGSIRPGNSHLAVAAARAAKNGMVNGRAFNKQSSS